MTRTKAGSQAFAMTGRAIDEPPVKLKRKINKKGKQNYVAHIN